MNFKALSRTMRIAALSLVLSLPAAFAMPSATKANAGKTIKYEWNGGTTTFVQDESLSAVRYQASIGRDKMAQRIAADATRMQWKIKSPLMPNSIVIVAGSPAEVSRAALAASAPVAAVYPVFHIPADPKTPFIATEDIILKFKQEVSEAQLQDFLRKYNLALKRAMFGPGMFVVSGTVSGAEAIAFAKQLSSAPGVEFAEPDFVTQFHIEAIPKPSDTYIDNQWHIANFKTNTTGTRGFTNADCDVYRFWGLSADLPTKGEGMIVAVLDSGVDHYHPDLAGQLVAGYDFVDNDDFAQPEWGMQWVAEPDPADPGKVVYKQVGYPPEAHGTCCAGIIAAVADNGIGVAGIAPKARIMPVRVLGSSGSGQWSWASDGIYFAVDRGADLISMSLGGYGGGSALTAAVNYAATNGRLTKGTVILAASGNEYGTISYPAALSYVISVGAVSDRNNRISYSNAGPNLDIVAPSQDLPWAEYGGYPTYWPDGGYPTLITDELRTGIWTTDIAGVYGYNAGGNPPTIPGDTKGDYFDAFNGTSAACPVAAGCATLILARYPALTATELRSLIQKYADMPGGADYFLSPEAYVYKSGTPAASAADDPCRPEMKNFDMGYGRINPYNVAMKIAKPVPFRDVTVVFDHDWTLTTDTLGWKSQVDKEVKILPIIKGAEEDPEPIVINNWCIPYIGSGWVETLEYAPDEEAGIDYDDKYGIIDAGLMPLDNTSGLYPPWWTQNDPADGIPPEQNGTETFYNEATNETLTSTAFPLEGPGKYAMVVLDHCFSMEIRDSSQNTSQYSMSMDLGYVEAALFNSKDMESGGTFSFRPVGLIRGTSAENMDYYQEVAGEFPGGETKRITQTFPLGKLNGADTVILRLRFRACKDHDPYVSPPAFGWRIFRTQILQYNLNEYMYEAAPIGMMPDWSSDERSIFMITGFSPHTYLLLKGVDLPLRNMESGDLCQFYDSPFNANAYIERGFVARDIQATGLDFHPFENKIAFCFNTVGNPNQATVWTENDDGFAGNNVLQGVSLAARDIRYSPDGNLFVFANSSTNQLHVIRADSTFNFPPIKPFVRLGSNLYLNRVQYPVFAFDNSRIIFAAALDPEPDAPLDLYILKRPTVVSDPNTAVDAEAKSLLRQTDWEQTSENMPDLAPDGTTLIFTTNAKSPSAGDFDVVPYPGLAVLRNLKQVVIQNATPVVEDFYRSFSKMTYRTPRFSPSGEQIVFALSATGKEREIIQQLNLGAYNPGPQPTSLPPATPAPTVTMPPTPTPYPTVAPAQITKLADLDFSQSEYGWTAVALSPYKTPTYTHITTTGGGMQLKSNNNNADTVGALMSPAGLAPVYQDSVTLARFWISAQATSDDLAPRLRVRAQSPLYQDNQELEIQSLGNNRQSPRATKAAYDLIISPPEGIANQPGGQDAYTLYFDLINVGGSDDPNGGATLHRLEIWRIPITLLSESNLFASASFDYQAEGWAQDTITNPSGFVRPSYAQKDGSLTLTAAANQATFGFWFDDAVPYSTFIPDDINLYMFRVDYRVYSTKTNAADVPGFRVRTFTADYQLGLTRRIINHPSCDHQYIPVNGKPEEKIYSTYVRPVRTYDRYYVNLAFDITAFSPEALSGGEVGLDEVKAYLVRFNGYPAP